MGWGGGWGGGGGTGGGTAGAAGPRRGCRVGTHNCSAHQGIRSPAAVGGGDQTAGRPAGPGTRAGLLEGSASAGRLPLPRLTSVRKSNPHSLMQWACERGDERAGSAHLAAKAHPSSSKAGDERLRCSLLMLRVQGGAACLPLAPRPLRSARAPAREESSGRCQQAKRAKPQASGQRTLAHPAADAHFACRCAAASLPVASLLTHRHWRLLPSKQAFSACCLPTKVTLLELTAEFFRARSRSMETAASSGVMYTNWYLPVGGTSMGGGEGGSGDLQGQWEWPTGEAGTG